MGNEEIITSTHFSGLLDQCSKPANAACLTGCLPHSGSSIKGSCASSFIFFPHPDILEPPSFSAWFNLSAQLAKGRLCLLSFLAEPQSYCGFSLGYFTHSLAVWGVGEGLLAQTPPSAAPASASLANHKLEK